MVNFSLKIFKERLKLFQQESKQFKIGKMPMQIVPICG